MNDKEFNMIVYTVEQSDVHKTYSRNDGFIALTDAKNYRTVIKKEEHSFEEAKAILLKYNIKY